MSDLENVMDNINVVDYRIIVEINPNWESVPKEYYKALKGYNIKWIITWFCKEFMDVVADYALAIKINSGEIDSNQIAELKDYAKQNGIVVIDEETRRKEPVTTISMEEYRSYKYGERKWKYITRKIIKKVSREIKG